MGSKLVRDKIVEIIEKSGKDCTFRVLDNDEEYENALKRKLSEEIGEFFENPCEEELADIYEVLEALAQFHSVDLYDTESTRQAKKSGHGGFMQRVFLEEVSEQV